MRRRSWLLGTATSLLACRARAPESAARARPRGVLRVLSLNLAHGRGRSVVQSSVRSEAWYRSNLDTIATVLEQQAADVVALQEAELGSQWAGDFDHVRYLAHRARYPHVVANAHVVSDRKRYGTALLSRRPLADSGGHSFERQGRWNKGFSTALMTVGPKTPPLVAVSLHLDFARATVRRAQVAELVEILSELRRARPELLAVLMGDFNDSGLDDDDPVGVAMRTLGLHTLGSRIEEATYPATGRRLDWILASKPLRFRDYRVVTQAKVADHRPVVADLEFDPG